nr:small integral membrane protein 5 isoform X2 [Chlorocebus sabaeus]
MSRLLSSAPNSGPAHGMGVGERERRGKEEEGGQRELILSPSSPLRAEDDQQQKSQAETAAGCQQRGWAEAPRGAAAPGTHGGSTRTARGGSALGHCCLAPDTSAPSPAGGPTGSQRSMAATDFVQEMRAVGERLLLKLQRLPQAEPVEIVAFSVIVLFTA